MITERPLPEQQLGYLFVRLADRVRKQWEARLRGRSINPRQFSVLAWLDARPGLNANELARRVMVTPQSMSESLLALVDAGLVARAEAPKPGKSIALGLTSKGKQILASAYPLVAESNEESFAVLSPSERKTLAKLLWKLYDEPAPAT